MSISGYLGDDHRICDAHFVELENRIQREDWSAALSALDTFIGRLLRHFAMEEEVLFPAMETALGQHQGPTLIMRMEHADMRQLLVDLQEAVRNHDRDMCTSTGDTLLIMLQQHNTKEEQVLYPMADRLLDDEGAALISRLQAVA